MNKTDFLRLSRARLTEAKALFTAGHYSGSYYLAGYSVECAIKACVTKQFKRHTVPDRDLVNKFYQHNLDSLLRLASIRDRLDKDMDKDKDLKLNWAIVKDWTVESRYRAIIPEALARDLLLAVTARKHGILSWVKKCI